MRGLNRRLNRDTVLKVVMRVENRSCLLDPGAVCIGTAHSVALDTIPLTSIIEHCDPADLILALLNPNGPAVISSSRQKRIVTNLNEGRELTSPG